MCAFATDDITEYLKRVPYQETYNYMMKITAGDPAKLNIWASGAKPVLHKAGEDVIVRENNDTSYKQAFIDLSEGPVTLTSTVADQPRWRNSIDTSAASAVSGTLQPALTRPFAVSTNTRRRHDVVTGFQRQPDRCLGARLAAARVKCGSVALVDI